MARLLVILVLLLTACARPGEIGADGASSEQALSETSTPAAPSAEPAVEEPQYSCFSAPYPASTWDGTRPASELATHPGYSTLVQHGGADGIEPWFVLEEGHDRLVIARERAVAREPGDDILRTHDILEVSDVGASNVQGWMLTQASSCAPQLVLEGLGSAEVWLAHEPEPTDTTIDLLVMELGCNSGQDAAGHIEVLEQTTTEEAVEIMVAVRPRGGDQTCPSNPATSYTLTLDDPIGQRRVLDTSVYPPRPLDVAPADLHQVD